MNTSIYSSSTYYTLAMRLLYGTHFHDRYRAVSELVSPHSTVVDACCGDAYLYRGYLQKKGCRYIGLDNSPAMVEAGEKAGIDVRLWDAKSDPVPAADYIVLQGALCHFMPGGEEIIARLIPAARKAVIVSEPIRSSRTASHPFFTGISKAFTAPIDDDGSYSGERFTPLRLRRLLGRLSGFDRALFVPGGREMIGIFRAGQGNPTRFVG